MGIEGSEWGVGLALPPGFGVGTRVRQAVPLRPASRWQLPEGLFLFAGNLGKERGNFGRLEKGENTNRRGPLVKAERLVSHATYAIAKPSAGVWQSRKTI
jgi:hypothetical protein